MPWKAKQVDGKWCSVNTENGKKVACFGSNKSKAEAHVKALYANTKEKFEEDDGAGIALLRVAYTNEPHLRLRKHPLSVVEVDGEKFIRHPVMVAGNYRHPKAKDGVLNLNTYDITDAKHKFNRVVANHYGNVTDAGVYTRPGHESREAWAWLSPEHGGWVSIEEDKGDTVLVGYGKPTSQDKLERIERGEYQYNSADLHLRYKSNQLSAEGDDGIVSWGELQILEDNSMGDVKLTSEEHEALLADQKEAGKLKLEIDKLADQLRSQKETLEAEKHSLEVRLQEFEVGDETDDIPEAVRLELAEMRKQLQEARRDKVLARLRQAIGLGSTPDAEGRILDSFILEEVKNFAMNKGFELDDAQFKLEQDASPQDTFYNAIYFLSYLIENMPRAISAESRTSPDEQRLSQSSGSGSLPFTEEDFAAMDAVIDDLNPFGVSVNGGG